MKAEINCDMGESFGLYSFGADEEIMPWITVANAACGFHGGDPVVLRNTVALARQHGVKVGAHPGLPDLQGFGRRPLQMQPEEITALVLYQVGALSAFLREQGLPLNHIKPHGALYGMAAREEAVAHAICDAAEVYGVPLYGMPHTLHETVYTARGIPFVAEFYADLEYDDEGKVIITRKHDAVDPQWAAERVQRALDEGLTRSASGRDVPVRPEAICVHSDTPGAVGLARSVRSALDAAGVGVRRFTE